jgi:hypothetical protein
MYKVISVFFSEHIETTALVLKEMYGESNILADFTRRFLEIFRAK